MKRLVIFTLFLLLVVSAFAESYTIGDGTSTQSYIPFYGFYNYNWSKVIYTQAEINAAGLTSASNIIGIGFFVGNSPSHYSMLDQRVFVRHTTAPAYETTDVGYPDNTQFQQVFQGNLTYNGGGWFYIAFSAPFAWNGSQNIEFLFENWDSTWSSNYPNFQYTSTNPDYKAVYKHQDASFPAVDGTRTYNRPNIQLITPTTTPPDPAVAVSPQPGATLVSPFATLNWLPGNIWPDGYRLSFGTNNPPTNHVNNQDMGLATTYDPSPDLQLNTTYYWQVVPYNAHGSASNCPVWSFTTHGDPGVTTLPYSQNWDAVTAPELPFDWTNIVQSTSASATVSTYSSNTYAHSLPNCVRLYNPSDSEATLILVGPPIMAPLSVDTIRLRFWARSSSSNYPLSIGVMSNPQDPATYTELHNLSLTTTITEYVVNLSSYTGTGTHICFKHGLGGTSRSLYVDDVVFEEIAPNDLACTALTGNTTPSAGTESTYSATIHNNGTATQSVYTVKLYDGNNTELASVSGTTVEPDATAQIALNWTPAAEGPASLYAKVFLAGDINPTNDQSPNLDVSVQPAGSIVVTVGEGNLAEGVPLEFYYKHSLHQAIYFQNELNMFGHITALTFYNNFVTDLPGKPCKFWLGQTNLNDLSGGWILPSDGLTLVYDGTVDFPSGQNTITIPLQTPFTYTHGNLVLYACRPMDSNYYSSSDNFQAQTVGNNRARLLRSDSTTYDPLNPSAAGTLSGTFAKTSFHMTSLGPDPMFIVSPSSHDFGTVLMNTTQNQTFTIANGGGGTLTVNSISISGNPFFTLQDLPTLPASLVIGQNITFVARYNPTAAGTHTATITITDNRGNRLTHTVELTGTCLDPSIYTLPYSQDFDSVTAPTLPIDWSAIVQSTSTSAVCATYASTTYAHSQPNCVRLYNPSDSEATLILVGPPIMAPLSVDTIRLKFWARSSGSNYPLSIGVMSNPQDPTTYTEVQNLSLTTTLTEYVVNLTSYTGTGTHICFKHGLGGTTRSLYVDDVVFEQIAPNDLACERLSGNTTPTAGNATTYNATIRNWGTASQSTYTVKLYNGDNVELATANGVTVAPDATVDVPLTWTPTAEGSVVLYAKVFLAGDINPTNDQSPNLNVLVMPSGIHVVIVGEGTSLDGRPVEFYYKNSLFQCLYYPEELGMFGSITALSFYNNFVTNLPDKPTKLWLGSTQSSDLSAGWILPSDGLTLVYDGNVTYPSGENTITIPLQTPYNYTGGNLVLYANRPWEDTYYNSGDDFRVQTVGSNRARLLRADSTQYDPAAPSAAGTLSGTFPMTGFHLGPIGNTPLFTVSATAVDFGTILVNTDNTRQISIGNAGGGSFTINSISIAGNPFYTLSGLPALPATVNFGQPLNFTLNYSPTTEGTHTATITIVDNINRETHTITVTANCIDTQITTLPYVQNFDAVATPDLPPDWGSIIQSTSTSAFVGTYASTTYAHSQPSCVRLYNPSDANATLILLAPPYAPAIATNTTRVKFWARSSSSNYPLSVGVIADPLDPTTYTEVQSIALTTTITEYVVPFNGYTGAGHTIAFKHGLGGTGRSLYLDDVMLEVIPDNDLAATAIAGNYTPSLGQPSTYTASVFNWGTQPQSTYEVKLFKVATPTDIELATAPGVQVAPGATASVALTWTPDTEGAATIYARVVLTGDQNNLNDRSPDLNVLVQPAGIFAYTVGDGSQTARTPIDFYFKNSVQQYLIYPAEIGNFIGIFTGMYLYNNFIQDLLDKPINVWLGTTTLEDMSGGWVPIQNHTQVFSGNLNFPIGENVITIPFANPYLYLNGENLILTFQRPMDESYYNSSNYFKAQTVGSNRARKIQSDSTVYDPADMTATGTLTGQFPMTTFFGIPGGVGHLNGTVTGAGGTPLEGVAVAFATGGYHTVTNAQGQYQINNILPNTYTVNFSAYGHVDATRTVTIAEDETETLNVSMTPMAMVNVTGQVNASDTGAGISGASIHLQGYANYDANTTASGGFTIPGVYANQTYDYVIMAPGYTSLQGTINVGASNHNMGTITLNEIAYAPHSVVADENDAGTVVELTWQAPDPNAVEITESFEDTVFPPEDWTQTITNTGEANSAGLYPTWCRFGTTTLNGQQANPTDGAYQCGLVWNYNHQDEWLITPAFNCPPSAYLSFDSFVFLGSTHEDHYYVKISQDNGATWTEIWDASAQTGGWNYYASPITIDLAVYSGQQIKLAFNATDGPDDTGLWYHWVIDNIYIGNALTPAAAPAQTIRFSEADLVVKSAGTSGFSVRPLANGNPSRDQRNGGNREEPRLPFPDEIRAVPQNGRPLVGYKVWRLTQGNENNEASWLCLTPEVITETNLSDTGWQSVPNGNYRWAVKAIYLNDVSSVPSFSGVIEKIQYTGLIAGVVRGANSTPIAGAQITANGVTATTNNGGAYTLMLPVGTYDVTASATGYVSQTAQGIQVNANQTTTLNFIMALPNDDVVEVAATALIGNYPNPFNPETTISYSVKELSPVKIEIYNTKGQLIRTLVNQIQPRGFYSEIWNGTDERGNPVASGVYMYRMTAGNYRSHRKMMLIK